MSTVLEQIEQQIAKLSSKAVRKNTGVIRAVADGVAKIDGLSDVMYNEMVSFPGGAIGIALAGPAWLTLDKGRGDAGEVTDEPAALVYQQELSTEHTPAALPVTSNAATVVTLRTGDGRCGDELLEAEAREEVQTEAAREAKAAEVLRGGSAESFSETGQRL